ncbi:hypothetical protein JYK14_19000 [Siccirubricoccus sp. KC 17139]|uniref:Uncharacterized protein n=1 Tax=Siccirubricoccus soli TaxID=2899147 RepID=A0ABT1D8H1_9PROT|nr:hypothetical protein [Siccirubricoccus soli]MCO6418236.1 hypothetical protein [Siccirubricoccus soli]MCP2684371.1 hypothetical protein [Siccirubricoccus soli]
MATERKGSGETGWTPEEKTPDPAGRGGSGKAAGEAEPKGRPTGEREKTETAADRVEQDQPRRR